MGPSGMSQADSENRNAMSFSELVAWAWRETPPVHRNTGNLLIHIVAVPLFVLGHAFLLGGVLASGWLAVAGFCALSFPLQFRVSVTPSSGSRYIPLQGRGILCDASMQSSSSISGAFFSPASGT